MVIDVYVVAFSPFLLFSPSSKPSLPQMSSSPSSPSPTSPTSLAVVQATTSSLQRRAETERAASSRLRRKVEEGHTARESRDAWSRVGVDSRGVVEETTVDWVRSLCSLCSARVNELTE